MTTQSITEQGTVDVAMASNGVATVTFFHPAHNSLPGKLLGQLAQTITELGQRAEAKVLVLKSGGDRTFCAGASFDELLAIENKEQGLEFFSGFAKVINAARSCGKIIVGRVQGKAIGGGVGVAASTDYCVATKHAAVKLSELAIGIGPFVVGPACERKLGTAAFNELALDASEFRSAEWAAQKGLYTEVVEDAAALDEAVARIADKLAGYNPEALKAMKQVFWQGTEHWSTLLTERAAISGRLVLSDFTRQALAKFKNK